MKWNVGSDLTSWPPGEIEPDMEFRSWIGPPTSSDPRWRFDADMSPKWLAGAANHRRTKELTTWFLRSTPEQRHKASKAGISGPILIRTGWNISRWNSERFMTVTAGLRLVTIAVKAKRPPRAALRERVLKCPDPRAAMMMTIRAPAVLSLSDLLEWLPPSVVTEWADFIFTTYANRMPSGVEEFLVAARRIEVYRQAIAVVDIMRT